MIRKSLLLAGAALLAATPAVTHPDHSLGESRWVFGRNSLEAQLDLGASMLAHVKELKANRSQLLKMSDAQLARLATVLQAYVDRKLTITINNEAHRARITRVARGHHDFISIGLTVDGIAFDQPINAVTIDYRLLIEETGNHHMNLAAAFAGEERIATHTFSKEATALELSIRGGS